jgi:hypothetical protein
MKVFKKLQQARVALLDANLKKSGKNKFAGFEYFELGDFMPTINKIFLDIGLCGVVHFTNDYAILTIYDADSEAAECIDFRSPMVFASNPKGQAIQDLGSTHTYLRRYLWLLAMDIVESDTVDALPQKDAPKVDTPKPTPRLIRQSLRRQTLLNKLSLLTRQSKRASNANHWLTFQACGKTIRNRLMKSRQQTRTNLPACKRLLQILNHLFRSKKWKDSM